MSSLNHSSASRESGGAWQPVSTAPFDRNIELAVIDRDGTHALIFPCRRVVDGWMNVRTKEIMTRLLPSHWREWHGD